MVRMDAELLTEEYRDRIVVKDPIDAVREYREIRKDVALLLEDGFIDGAGAKAIIDELKITVEEMYLEWA